MAKSEAHERSSPDFGQFLDEIARHRATLVKPSRGIFHGLGASRRAAAQATKADLSALPTNQSRRPMTGGAMWLIRSAAPKRSAVACATRARDARGREKMPRARA